MANKDIMSANRMRILVACEESQAVTTRLRAAGHTAFSCDILPCSGGHPEWHLQRDVTELLKERWDAILAFPPCTYLTVTGNRWFDIDKYGLKAVIRHFDRYDAVAFFKLFADADCPRIAIENPVGTMSTRWRKPDQIIQPWQFGDPVEKKTCLWLKGLPKLTDTKVVQPLERIKFASGRTMTPWFAESWNLPRADRATARSKTWPGIADAMVSQWFPSPQNQAAEWLKDLL
jgi:hypothetical protein